MAPTSRAKGTGTITRRGNSLLARYSAPDGTKPSKSFPILSNRPKPTKADEQRAYDAANAWLNEEIAAIHAGQWKTKRQREAEKRAAEQAAQAEIFSVYAEAWIRTRRTRSGDELRPRTRGEYKRYLTEGLARFADLPLSGITPAMVREWHSNRIAGVTRDSQDRADEHGLPEGKSLRTGETAAAREARFLASVLNTAVQDGLIPTNPVPANLTKSSTKIKHRIPTPEELARIVHYLPEEWRAPVLIAAFGGLRIGEWRALRRQDFSLSTRPETGEQFYIVKVERQAQYEPDTHWTVGPPKSSEGVRNVTLPSHVTTAITNHLERFTGPFPGSLIVEPKRGAPFMQSSVFYKQWNAARDKAGVSPEVRGHDLRGFTSTSYTRHGATMKEAMAIMGQSSLAAAMVYQAATGRESELANRIPALPKFTPSNVADLKREGQA